MKKQWDETTAILSEFQEELKDYIEKLPQSKALQKQQNKVLQLWKESSKKINEFDNFVSPISPVDILFPNENEKFINTWNYWKEYIAEQHGIIMRSRFEKKALKLLWEFAEEDYKKAIEYLNYAMSRGYPRFFKPGKNTNTQKPKDESCDPDFN